MAKIVLAGGSGFLGQILSAHFLSKNNEVIILTRHIKKFPFNVKQILWDGKNLGPWVNQLENSTVLINLTGKSVNCRYNQKNKKEILLSRLQSTQVLGDAIRLLQQPPPLWINAASATIYRHAEDRPQDEYTGELGIGFSVNVCQQWEQLFFTQNTPNTRKIGLRLAIVLGKNGGVMPYFKNLARLGLGGKQGNGQQYFSWVHEQDIISIVDFFINQTSLEGVFNVAAPQPITNSAFMRAVRQAFAAPFGLNTPAWLLKIGAWFIGTETELILKSRWVLPRRLTEAGYQFKIKTIEAALAASR
ncbi:TIGR01777 family protein [Adhaeribacter swui]|uniref:TIGR01777 family protein n=1 Tax=Adhaeribacter swui TaxID=2086471 RepID=A0A7G7G732_9BACT|nr:TIGR01777 family oxidoreductase [Adhaeribacter swui]QNF32966.1 TIGR01777 family protein [Adhaeribacter swui]